MIGIIDYGMGNLRSVQKALQRVGATARILPAPDTSEMSEKVSHLVLPGVGAFGDGMAHLRECGWIEPIREFIASGRPFLGICLGMQLLFEGSQEDAPSPDQPVEGLGVLPGQVVRFHGEAFGPGRCKVPHMGWNTLFWERDDPLLGGVEQGAAVYFVHSYYVQPRMSNDVNVTSARSEYPDAHPFCATVWRDNLWATQFHPEKSQAVGLRMLANFASFK